MAESKTEKQKVQEITEKLEQGIKELFESEKYKTYLNTMSKFFCQALNPATNVASGFCIAINIVLLKL